MIVKGHDKKVIRNIKYKNMKSKKGPFKMKKTPAKHTGGKPGMIGSVASQLGGTNPGMFAGALGMLGGRKNEPLTPGNYVQNRGFGLGFRGMQNMRDALTSGRIKGRRNKKRRGMGALNTFKNRIKGIFG